MKTTIKTIAIAGLVAMSTLSFAGNKGEKSEKEVKVSPELDVRIVELNESSVAVTFAKLEGESVKVKIFDAYGVLMHTEKQSEGKAFLKRFDVSALPAGDYTYMVANEMYAVKKVITKD
ncbi:hypothetical protein [Reichenbachiella sp. MSK19-1]|uniref:hypothetical protein n=1 Tax=Reichenbachiella sp. MSK19-1 TaxID=1897631 RepID=UPI0011C3A4D1|nr:hypothetical protein [Reichenbachiella sp. MSK19-1]